MCSCGCCHMETGKTHGEAGAGGAPCSKEKPADGGKGTGGMAWYVYVLRCGDGSLYTGSTTDMQRRLREHQRGTGARYTRSRPPVELAYTEAAADRTAAQRREAAIKKLPRTEKLKLVETGQRALQKAEMRSNGA